MNLKNYILITGAAGFIGQHFIRALGVEHRLVCLDNFDPQIHGEQPSNSSSIINFDVSKDSFDILEEYGAPKAIVHLAAKTGTGQSMYELENYYMTNVVGSARLLDFAVKHKDVLKKFIFASSRSIYGEGSYSCTNCGSSFSGERTLSDLRRHNFDVKCPACGAVAVPCASTESCSARSSSHYALTKATIEQSLSIAFSDTVIEHCSLRFQNVYGIGQSLNNPYTGVLGIFASLALRNEEISIYENGKIGRDFVSVLDVAEVLKMALLEKTLPVCLNVGTGIVQNLETVAKMMVKYYNSNSNIRVTDAFRIGDIAVNYADLNRFHDVFGSYDFRRFEDELPAYLEWVRGVGGVDINKLEKSLDELKNHGVFSA